MTRPNILVVDDHPAALEALAAPLRERYEVLDVATVSAALAALPSADAVVLDLVLDDPVDMLVDVLAARHALAGRCVPVVVVSGLESDAAAVLAARHGWSTLPKPVAPEPLLAAVAAALENRPMPDTVPDASGARPTMTPPPPLELPRVSTRPTSPPPLVQAIDRLGDIVGVVVIYLLAHEGRIGGVEAVVAIGAILGVGTGLRHVVSSRLTGAAAGLGLVGLGVWHAWPVAEQLALTVARARGLAVLCLALAAATIAGCSGALVRDPAAQIAVRVAWPSVHKGAVSAGLCDDDPPAWLVGETPKREAADAGVNETGASVNETGASVNNSGDASAPAPNDAAEVGAP